MGINVRKRQWASAATTATALAPPSNYWLGAGAMMVGGPTSELAPHLLAGAFTDEAVARLRGRGSPSSTGLAALTAAGQAELIRRAMATGPAVDAALDGEIDTFRPPYPVGPAPRRLAALASPVALRPPSVEALKDIPYTAGSAAGSSNGSGDKLSTLDVYRLRSAPGDAPVLLHVHGGMWMGSDKRYEALPLLYRMAARGWVCVSINYRLCPKNPFPAQIIDVKRAIAWTRENIAAYGGDPAFIATTGGSAGGHLAALAALTPGDPQFQPGFEGADTSIQAAVPQYGIYDFSAESGTDRAVKRRDKFLAPMILKKDPATDPDAFTQASPAAHVHADAPPFFVLHGTADTGVEVEESRYFVDRLRQASQSTVVFAELPGGQHAYDHLNSIRARHAGRGIERFLGWAYAQRGRMRNGGEAERR